MAEKELEAGKAVRVNVSTEMWHAVRRARGKKEGQGEGVIKAVDPDRGVLVEPDDKTATNGSLSKIYP